MLAIVERSLAGVGRDLLRPGGQRGVQDNGSRQLRRARVPVCSISTARVGAPQSRSSRIVSIRSRSRTRPSHEATATPPWPPREAPTQRDAEVVRRTELETRAPLPKRKPRLLGSSARPRADFDREEFSSADSEKDPGPISFERKNVLPAARTAACRRNAQTVCGGSRFVADRAINMRNEAPRWHDGVHAQRSANERRATCSRYALRTERIDSISVLA